MTREYKDPERAAAAKGREDKMRAQGFVSVNEAARLASVPRSTIYSWVATKELSDKRWSTGPGSVFVSLDDLKKKVPEAFGGKREKRTRAKKASA